MNDRDRFPWHLPACLAVIIVMFVVAVVCMVRDNNCRAVQGRMVDGVCIHDGTVSP